MLGTPQSSPRAPKTGDAPRSNPASTFTVLAAAVRNRHIPLPPHAGGGEMHVVNVTGSSSASDTRWQTAGMETMQPASLPARGCSPTSVFVPPSFKCPQRSSCRRSSSASSAWFELTPNFPKFTFFFLCLPKKRQVAGTKTRAVPVVVPTTKGSSAVGVVFCVLSSTALEAPFGWENPPAAGKMGLMVVQGWIGTPGL